MIEGFLFFHVYFFMVLAGVSTGKLQIRILWLSSFSIRQFNWLGFLSTVCELSTKIGTVRDPIECADASKVATRCRSDACGSYYSRCIKLFCQSYELCTYSRKFCCCCCCCVGILRPFDTFRARPVNLATLVLGLLLRQLTCRRKSEYLSIPEK